MELHAKADDMPVGVISTQLMTISISMILSVLIEIEYSPIRRGTVIRIEGSVYSPTG